jgi:ribonuclease PH
LYLKDNYFFGRIYLTIMENKLYNAVQKFIPLEGGREIMIETGKLAKQADGSVVVKQGDTMLLATVVAAKDAKEGTDFMPLQVEYKEKFAAAGRIPGGFMKREGKASDNEILVARLIDRALRPLFPADYHAEVFVTVNLISADKDIQADALAGLMAARCFYSDILFLSQNGKDHPVVGPELESYLNTFNDLLGTISANVVGDAARICAEIVYGFDAATDEEKATFASLRSQMDAALSGTRLSKDRAAKCLTTIMIPEALDY